MKRLACFLTLTLLAAPAGLFAQNSDQPAPPQSRAEKGESPAPFSRLAVSGGIGANGINMQVAVEANRYFNIRGIGNYFNYSLTKNVSGTNDTGTLNFATGGVSVDFYPFPNHGWRLSPGALFYNQNAVTATINVAGGKSFTMDNTTFWSSTVSPVTGNGGIVLNKTNPAFTMTTGWGNLISRHGGHFSVPFEVGAEFRRLAHRQVELRQRRRVHRPGTNQLRQREQLSPVHQRRERADRHLQQRPQRASGLSHLLHRHRLQLQDPLTRLASDR